jgi:hypothetical protein
MRELWKKRPKETPRAFGAFSDYLQMGPGRSLTECAERFGYRVNSLNNWSSVHQWRDRAQAYDTAELERSIQGREQVRERARQNLIDDIEESTRTIRGVRKGRVPMPECGDDCTLERCMCGVWVPVLDRHGKVVGRKPQIAASTRQAAAVATLDRCGLTPPKRVELTGADGEKLRLEASLQLGGLGDAELAALAAAFAPGDDQPDSD